MTRLQRFCLIFCVTVLAGLSAYAQSAPLVSDSRIKTLIYNENDVYSVLTHYGYQSNIEFGRNETVETISVGDRIAWQIVPAGRRLFIRALEESAHTNMTVVTNERTYQFDLKSTDGDRLPATSELAYVVRFYYPDQYGATPVPPIYTDDPYAMAPAYSAAPYAPVAAAPVAPPPPAYPAPLMAAPPQMPAPMPYAMAQQVPGGMYNYNYTYVGPPSAAPVKIFDDGQATFFKLPPGARELPQIFVVQPDGAEVPVQTRPLEAGYTVVNAVAPRFALKGNGSVVYVYNESL